MEQDRPPAGDALEEQARPAEESGAGAPGIGFDDLRFSPALGEMLVPAGRSGRLDVVDPESGAVDAVPGFSQQPIYSGGHDDGVTSADAAHFDAAWWLEHEDEAHQRYEAWMKRPAERSGPSAPSVPRSFLSSSRKNYSASPPPGLDEGFWRLLSPSRPRGIVPRRIRLRKLC